MQETVEQLGQYLDKEEMFDYLSYVYLGWRTTGGEWQNQVIDDFVMEQLTQAGYTDAGSGTTDSNNKSANDKSSATDDDYAWVTYFDDIADLTWSPEYAKLSVTTAADFEGKDALIDRIEVESAAFDPTSQTYQEHYGKNIDEMWDWITEKDASGNRVNVLNGKEAELNKRVHLAWNSSFTDPSGTKPSEAVGVEGELVYVGNIRNTAGWGQPAVYVHSNTEYSKADLAGKVLFTDGSLRNAFAYAQEVGAVAVASKASLNAYSTPKDENGNIIDPFYDSARYASGASLSSTKDSNIVEWQLSNNQYDAMMEILEKANGTPVMVKSVAIGEVYAMNDASKGGLGQAISLAEIKGSKYPDERIFLCAHVQEPSSNDNATGVATLLGMATQMKKMIDSGELERPERTITFMWGDEMTMASLYMSSHSAEKDKLVGVLDLDMTGEDPDKTGRSMRVEKTPDPSAVYNYTLDTLPWENSPAYDETFKDLTNSAGEFVRLPDSHTLWGAGSINGLFQEGFYLNDLYIASANGVIDYHDPEFEVDVCPYEGGSDHSVFLRSNVPALLTWHFTDYTYHTSIDTLAMSSGQEMEDVGITSLAAALFMANAVDGNEDIAKEVLTMVRDAAMERFDTEQQNTLNHQIYAKANGADYAAALENEKEVLEAWHDWYQEALTSIEWSLMHDNASAEFKALRAQYALELELRFDKAVNFATEMIGEEPGHENLVKVPAVAATADKDGNIEYWYCDFCDKYYADAEGKTEITKADTVVKYVPETVTPTPTPTPEDTDKPADKETPKTGDTTNMGVYVGLLVVAGLAGATAWKKRKVQ